jgi:hypothetical protein
MRAALEAAQPYKGGDATKLPILESLNNCDKHRFPPLLAAVGQVLRLDIGTFTGSSFEGPFMGPLKDGAVVVRFTPAPYSNVDMDLRVRFDVAFGGGYPGYGAYVVSFLSDTLSFIRDEIVPSLRAFL